MNWAAVAVISPFVVVPLALAVHAFVVLVQHRPRRRPTVAAAGRPAVAVYRRVSLADLVARAQHDAIAAATCPLTYLPVSPDPRRKES